MMTATTRKRRRRPRGSGWKPSARPRKGERKNTEKWKKSEKR